jgi:hypothetical protein
MGDWSDKRLLRGSLTRGLRSLKTLTWSRLQIRLSVHMMAKEIKSINYMVAVQIFVSLCDSNRSVWCPHPRQPFSLCTLYKGFSICFITKKGERVKLPTSVQVHPDHLVWETNKRSYFIGAFHQELENRKE